MSEQTVSDFLSDLCSATTKPGAQITHRKVEMSHFFVGQKVSKTDFSGSCIAHIELEMCCV